MNKCKDIRKMTDAELGSMFHALLFAYEKVFLNFYGKEETKKLFSYIIEELLPVLYNESDLVIDNSLNIEENIRRFECFLSNESFIKGLEIKKINNNEYVVDIQECSFALGGIHNTLAMKGGSCPYALLVAAVITNVEGEDHYVKVGESLYTEVGSKTTLNIE